VRTDVEQGAWYGSCPIGSLTQSNSTLYTHRN
jgi:hypothetical protein